MKNKSKPHKTFCLPFTVIGSVQKFSFISSKWGNYQKLDNQTIFRYTGTRAILSYGCKSTEVVIKVLKGKISNNLCLNLDGPSKGSIAVTA